MVNNYDVARAFIDGRRATGSNFMSTGDTLYSYNTAIAHRTRDGKIIINKTKYSQTTSKQLGYLTRSIPSTVEVEYVDDKGYGYDFTDDNDDVYKKHFKR